MIDQEQEPLGTEEPRILHVRVTNRNDFMIRDRFDSVPYLFEPNKPISIPVDAAAHIFGWREDIDLSDMRRHIQKRFGWNTPAMEINGQCNAFVDNLEIKPIIYRLVPVEASDEEGEATDDRRKSASRKQRPVADEAADLPLQQ